MGEIEDLFLQYLHIPILHSDIAPDIEEKLLYLGGKMVVLECLQ
jgi:hypothetical protein